MNKDEKFVRSHWRKVVTTDLDLAVYYGQERLFLCPSPHWDLMARQTQWYLDYIQTVKDRISILENIYPRMAKNKWDKHKDFFSGILRSERFLLSHIERGMRQPKKTKAPK